MFSTPKPVRLISRMLEITVETGDVVLDFFAGSCSLPNACLEFNKRINYIAVQLPEKIAENSVAYMSGFVNIAEVAKERIRCAGNKIRNEQSERLDLEGKNDIDLGFKVLKLDRSNFKPWQSPPKDISDEELIQQMELNVDHIDPNVEQEHLLYELLIKAGIMPIESIEQIELAGYKVFSVADGALLVHLENDIDKALIDLILEKEPQQFICLDKAFHGNDQLKANTVETFTSFNQGKEKIDQIEFRTV